MMSNDNNICFIDAIYKYFGIYELFILINDTDNSPEIKFYWDVRTAYHDAIMFGQIEDRAAARLNLIKDIKDRAKKYYDKSEEFLKLAEKLLILLVNDIESKSFVVGKKDNKILEVFDNIEEWPDTLKKSDLSFWRNKIIKRIKKSDGELEVGDDYLSKSDWKQYKLLLNNNYNVEFFSFYSSHVGEYFKQILIRTQTLERQLREKSLILKADSVAEHNNDIELRRLEVIITYFSDHYYLETCSKRAVKWSQIEAKPEELTKVIDIQEEDKKQIEPPQEEDSNSKIKPLPQPKKKDTWTEAIISSIQMFELKEKRTPTDNELWDFLINEDIGGFVVWYDKSKKNMTVEGEAPLNKANFKKRYTRLYKTNT